MKSGVRFKLQPADIELVEVQAGLEHIFIDAVEWSKNLSIHNSLDFYLKIKVELIKFLSDNLLPERRIAVSVVSMPDCITYISVIADNTEYFFDVSSTTTYHEPLTEIAEDSIIHQIW